MAEFVKVFNMRGFDRHAAPRWQMVPSVGTRYVALRDGAGDKVFSLDPTICTVSEITQRDLPTTGTRAQLQPKDRIFRLNGSRKGDTLIQAIGKSGIANLEVGVKHAKTLRVGFYFISDGAVPPHSTTRAPAEASEWLKQVNYVYNGQANLYFLIHHAKRVALPMDLGLSIDSFVHLRAEDLHINPWSGLAGGVNADVSVHLVWRVELLDNLGEENAFTVGKRAFVGDRVKTRVGVTIAHEIGHALGLSDEQVITFRLMYRAKQPRTGVDLSKTEVNRLHR
jgi:hypothetical protein